MPARRLRNSRPQGAGRAWRGQEDNSAPAASLVGAPAPAGRTDALRLLDDGDAAPAFNMALDEALLRGDEPATLRLYGWRPHAVSLGYFQRLRDFADVAATTPIVRRTTGGGAIHHGDELTWALVADAALWPLDLDAGYALLHDAVAGALATVGVTVHRLPAGAPPAARPHARWCFAVPGRHDLVAADGRKLCGSAQRRIRTARGARILQHGSIVFAQPTLTPFVASVADATDAALAAPPLRRALATGLASALGLQLVPGTATARETALARTLERERYGAREFLASR